MICGLELRCLENALMNIDLREKSPAFLESNKSLLDESYKNIKRGMRQEWPFYYGNLKEDVELRDVTKLGNLAKRACELYYILGTPVTDEFYLEKAFKLNDYSYLKTNDPYSAKNALFLSKALAFLSSEPEWCRVWKNYHDAVYRNPITEEYFLIASRLSDLGDLKKALATINYAVKKDIGKHKIEEAEDQIKHLNLLLSIQQKMYSKYKDPEFLLSNYFYSKEFIKNLDLHPKKSQVRNKMLYFLRMYIEESGFNGKLVMPETKKDCFEVIKHMDENSINLDIAYNALYGLVNNDLSHLNPNYITGLCERLSLLKSLGMKTKSKEHSFSIYTNISSIARNGNLNGQEKMLNRIACDFLESYLLNNEDDLNMDAELKKDYLTVVKNIASSSDNKRRLILAKNMLSRITDFDVAEDCNKIKNIINEKLYK